MSNRTSLYNTKIQSNWRVIVACALGIGVGVMALPYSTIGLFITSLESEFGWTRAEISLGATILLGIVTLLSPLSGWLADRYRATTLIFGSLVAQSICFVFLSKMSSDILWMYLTFAIMATFSIGASTIVFARIVCTNFFENRGLALGIVMTGNGVTAALSPHTLGKIINAHGWSAGYLALSALSITALLLILWLLRGHVTTSQQQDTSQPVAGGAPLSEAVRRSDFWLMGIAFFLGTLATTGMVVHLLPYLSDLNMEIESALKISSLIGIGLIGARLITGWLLDRFEAKLVAAVMMGLSACGLFILSTGQPGAAIFGALAVGLCIGAELDIIGYLTAQHFGLAHYGRIYGVLYMLCAGGTAMSPLYYGVMHDFAGSYNSSILYSGGFLVIAGLLLLILPPARRLHQNTVAT